MRQVIDKDKTELLAHLSSSRTSHPTDTHPPLNERIAALQGHFEDTHQLLGLVGESATSLLTNPEPLEEELTDDQARLLIQLGYAELPDESDETSSATATPESKTPINA